MPLYINDGKKPTEADGLTAGEHDAVDHTAGPFSLLDTAAHAAVSHAGILGLDDDATTTLGGPLTLTDADPCNQFINGDGADRTISLPTPAATNPPFFIVNEGLWLLDVQAADLTNLMNIRPGEGAKFISNGSRWAVSSVEKFSQQKLGQNYVFGGNVVNTQFFPANGSGPSGGNAGSSADNIGAFHVVMSAGFIDEVSWVSDGTPDARFNLYVNGAVQSEQVLTAEASGRYRLVTPIQVFLGDRIAIEQVTGGDQLLLQIRVRLTADDGYMLHFGGDVNVATDFFDAFGQFNNTANNPTEGPRTTITVSGSGNLIRLGYSLEAGGLTSDTVQIFKNGSLDSTVTLTNGSLVGAVLTGVETISVSFVDGDRIAIKSVVDRGDSVFAILTNVPGHSHCFQGNIGSGQFYGAWATNSASVGATARSDNDNYTLVMTRGRVVVSWNAAGAPTTPLDLYCFPASNPGLSLTGRGVESIDWTSGTQGTFKTSFVVGEGDIFAFLSQGADPGEVNILMVVK